MNDDEHAELVKHATDLVTMAVVMGGAYYLVFWIVSRFGILSRPMAWALVGMAIIGVLFTYDRIVVESDD